MPPEQARAEFFCRLINGPIESSVLQLIGELQIESNGVLGCVAELSRLLAMYQVDVTPDLSLGELDTIRLVRFRQRSPQTIEEELAHHLAQGESANCELKSTLHFNMKQYAAKPDLSVEQYRSDDVLHAALKTIAAFLNSDGGRLYIGVQDDGGPCGLEHDFKLKATSDGDRWQLFLRDLVKSRFSDGAAANDYLSIRLEMISAVTLAAIDVTPRSKLTVLADAKGFQQIYRRQGNRTDSVGMHEIEEYVLSRRDRRLGT